MVFQVSNPIHEYFVEISKITYRRAPEFGMAADGNYGRSCRCLVGRIWYRYVGWSHALICTLDSSSNSLLSSLGMGKNLSVFIVYVMSFSLWIVRQYAPWFLCVIITRMGRWYVSSLPTFSSRFLL